MSLDIWSKEDIRNVILAAHASEAEVAPHASGAEGALPDETAFRAGYEAALATLATAFGIAGSSDGRLRAPGVVIPASRLALSYRAEQALYRLLASREE